MLAPASSHSCKTVLQRLRAALYKLVPRRFDKLDVPVFKKSKLNISATLAEKSKFMSKPNDMDDDEYDKDVLIGSLIKSSISSNMLRVSDVSRAPDRASSASVSFIIARISSADKPT